MKTGSKGRFYAPKSFATGSKDWWWVVLFSTVTASLYLHAIQGKERSLASLQARDLEMEKERLYALDTKEDLMLRIQSQNDPAWIEMVLLRDLGVVPEGWLKVHFKK